MKKIALILIMFGTHHLAFAVEKAPSVLIEAYQHSSDLDFREKIELLRENHTSYETRPAFLDVEGFFEQNLDKNDWVEIINFLYPNCKAGLSLLNFNAFYITLENGEVIWPEIDEQSYISTYIEWYKKKRRDENGVYYKYNDVIDGQYIIHPNSSFNGTLYINFSDENNIVFDQKFIEDQSFSKSCTKRSVTKDNFK